jgi:uncharacterized protein YdhG (YjbR/CyaY superfamily)
LQQFLKLYVCIIFKNKDKMEKHIDIDAYIATFPESTQKILEQVRATVKKAAPDAEEAIRYAMPTFRPNESNLVFFAGYKNHIGFYATPTGHEAFKDALSIYKQGKGSVQFPLDKPIPYNLITQIVQFRVQENINKAQPKNHK